MNWITLLLKECEKNNDTFSNISSTLPIKKMKEPFNSDFGSGGGESFFAWSNKFVYASNNYDGVACVSSLPRDPNCKTYWL